MWYVHGVTSYATWLVMGGRLLDIVYGSERGGGCCLGWVMGVLELLGRCKLLNSRLPELVLVVGAGLCIV